MFYTYLIRFRIHKLLRQTITCEDDFKKGKIYNALNSDICIKKQFKNTLTKSDILTKRLVFLPVDWDKKGLLCIYETAPYDE